MLCILQSVGINTQDKTVKSGGGGKRFGPSITLKFNRISNQKMVNGLKNFKKAQKEKENKNSVSVKI